MSSSNQAALLNQQQPFLSGVSVFQADEHIEAVCLSNDLGQNYEGLPPTYNQVKAAMYSGRIPAVKLRNGHWAALRSKRDDIAAFFGMTPKASA